MYHHYKIHPVSVVGNCSAWVWCITESW